jgi:hypothetical protein
MDLTPSMVKLGILYPIIYCFIDDVPIKAFHLFGIAMFFFARCFARKITSCKSMRWVYWRGSCLQDSPGYSPGADPTKQLVVDQPLNYDPFIVGIIHFMELFFHLLGS